MVERQLYHLEVRESTTITITTDIIMVIDSLESARVVVLVTLVTELRNTAVKSKARGGIVTSLVYSRSGVVVVDFCCFITFFIFLKLKKL